MTPNTTLHPRWIVARLAFALLVVGALIGCTASSQTSERELVTSEDVLEPPVVDPPQAPAGGEVAKSGDTVLENSEDSTAERPAACSEPISRGPCRARVTRYHFDAASGACATFTWGGCRPGANNFETKEACEQACSL